MPWYYAGLEAKPVGPVSLEELHARRVGGTISDDTYVIEHTGQSNEPRAWKRYREIFPPSPGLPPIPAAFTPPPAPPTTVMPPAPPAPQPHPLFPSAAIAPGSIPHPIFPPTAAPHLRPPAHKTNSWCAWGFGLGLTGFLLSFACGIGVLVALPALFVCIVGLMEVHKHRDQAGRGMAIAGLVLAIVSLLIVFILAVSLAIPAIKAHEQTTTEQTSNDSE